MAYGTPIKQTNKAVSYTSNNSEYVDPLAYAGTRQDERLIRTGSNHTSFINPDGSLTEYIKTTRLAKRIVGFEMIVRRRRKVLGFRKVGGKPIYRYLNSSEPSGSGKRKKTIIGYSETRLRYIYTYETYKYKRNIWATVPVVKYVKRVRSVTSAPILSPNPLHFQSYKAYGLDASCAIKLRGKSPDHPGALCTTLIVGVISGQHNVENLTSFGYEATTRALYWSPTVDVVQDELEDRALFKLNSNAQGGVAKVSQMMAERSQIKKTIGSVCLNTLELLLKGKRKLASLALDAVEDPRAIANTYLAYVYGLRPILSDLQGTYNEIVHRENAWFRVKGVAKREWTEYSVQQLSDFCIMRIKEDYTVIVKQQCTITGTSSASRFLASHGLTNASSVVWEVIPFSFIVDWFLPIGAFLSQPDAFEGATVASWHKTLIRKKVTSIELFHVGQNSSYEVFETGMQSFSATNFACDRTIMSGIPPLASLRFKNPIGVEHIANSFFLLCQLLKR
jgi:hypothetical protein